MPIASVVLRGGNYTTTALMALAAKHGHGRRQSRESPGGRIVGELSLGGIPLAGLFSSKAKAQQQTTPDKQSLPSLFFVPLTHLLSPPFPDSPVTSPSQKLSKLLQKLPVHFVEPLGLGTVHIDNRYRLPLRMLLLLMFPKIQHVHHDGHDNLALARTVARDVPRERVHVGHQLGLLRRGGGAAHAAAKGDRLASHLPLERTQDQGRVVGTGRGVEDVEAWWFSFSCQRKLV